MGAAQPLSTRRSATNSAVSIENVTFQVAAATILSGIDLSVAPGHVVALLGPSGCGKTSLLRLVAGLVPPTSGTIAIAERPVVAPGVFLPPEQRQLGMVFQDYALWPHLSVGENVSFPLEMGGVRKAARASAVARSLGRVGLQGFEHRAVSSLSGGQQQRVAIARAIVAEPPLVLFDEPLSNLDEALRETLVDELGQLIRELRLTALYVTHDQEEAFALADRVAVMDAGRILQVDAPERLVKAPSCAAVARFLKLGTVLSVGSGSAGHRLAGSAIAVRPPADHHAATEVLLPREKVRLCAPDRGQLAGRVASSRFTSGGYQTTIHVDGASKDAVASVLASERLHVGDPVGLAFSVDDLVWFETGRIGSIEKGASHAA